MSLALLSRAVLCRMAKARGKSFICFAAGTVALSLWLVGTSTLCRAEGLIGEQRQRAARSALVGEWSADVGKVKLRLKISGDGRFVLEGKESTYSLEGDTLKLRGGTTELTYQVDLAADQLTLSGGDLASPLKFTRLREAGSYARRLFHFSKNTTVGTLYRILLIIAVAVACRLIIALLRVASRFVIYSEWGPLKFLYSRHKNRAMTLHSLALNVAKYIVYFASLGFILTELGVNYTAYLASLSVIGLAIGFGSQGLVQDMVTGFFIIFEGQFDVGDMVEIPPHTGIVEELGIRMTKLRNYLGQTVVIPNRNIATVGNYARGAQQTWVDVAVVNRKAAEQAARPLQELVKEVAWQFKGVILSGPKVLGPLSLATGEHFVRLQLAIWPQQQWVIDGQLVPRIRELLTREGVEIPGDRVAVFYHSRDRRAAPSMRRFMYRLRKRPSGPQGQRQAKSSRR